jgi:hypothetical protein
MPLFETILFGLGGFVLAIAFSLFTRSLRSIFTDIRVWLGSSAAGVVASVASLLIQVEGFTGTGIRISKGWPKPYQFDWTSFDQTEASSSFNEFYFAGNCFFYVGLSFLIFTFIASFLRSTSQMK